MQNWATMTRTHKVEYVVSLLSISYPLYGAEIIWHRIPISKVDLRHALPILDAFFGAKSFSSNHIFIAEELCIRSTQLICLIIRSSETFAIAQHGQKDIPRNSETDSATSKGS